MAFILEFIFEVILEGLFAYVKNNQKNRWIRLLTVFILLIIYVSIIGGLTYLAAISIQNNILAGLAVIAMLVFVIIFGVMAYKKQLNTKDVVELGGFD